MQQINKQLNKKNKRVINYDAHDDEKIKNIEDRTLRYS